MLATTIFAWSIRYLRKHLLRVLNKQVTGVEESDIKYVLTVPTVWNDGAKQFRREAIEACIENANLKLALEPEVVSKWCQIVTTYVKAHLSKAGTQFVVVDLGDCSHDDKQALKVSNQYLNRIEKIWGDTKTLLLGDTIAHANVQAVKEDFDGNIHKEAQIVIINNRKMVENVFRVFARMDEEVK